MKRSNAICSLMFGVYSEIVMKQVLNLCWIRGF